jgi:hypothetical protein
MKHPDRPMDERLAHMVRLLKDADAGTLDALECPNCHQHSVSVWFTHPGEGIYRTWFICTECSFQRRAQNVGVPPHYSEDRVSERLENYDESLLAKAHFKRPKDKA